MKNLFAIFLLACFTLAGQQRPAQNTGTKTVTVTEGTNIIATVAPDQSRIVFDLQGSLWAIPFKGGTAKQLTDPLFEPTRPTTLPRVTPLRSRPTKRRDVSHLGHEAGRFRRASAHQRAWRTTRAAILARWHKGRVFVQPRI